MADLDALRVLLTRRCMPRPVFIWGTLGNGRGQVRVEGSAELVWVRLGSKAVFEVRNVFVPPMNGLPIVIGELPWEEGVVQVLDVDPDKVAFYCR